MANHSDDSMSEGGDTDIYGHCSELLVEEGANVSSGDIIAYAGNSGITTGGVTIINVN